MIGFIRLPRKIIHEKLHLLICLCIAFSLPLTGRTPVFITLLLLNWLIEGGLKLKFQRIFENKFALLFIAFYGLHLLGLLYTKNTDAGLFNLQVKLSILIFPLILFSRPLGKEAIQKVFYALIAGCIVSAIIMLIRATYLYISFDENNFYYELFSSFLIHPGYLALYLNFAIAWLLVGLSNNRFLARKNEVNYAILVLFFFSVIEVMLISKLGLISMTLLYLGFLILYVVSRKKYLFGITGLIAMALLAFGAFKLFPKVSERITNVISAVKKDNPDNANAESTAVRLLIWKAANQVISENFWIGTGTGDVQDKLVKEYEKRGMAGAIEHNLNAHNAYYQVFLALGVSGLILLLADLLIPLGFSIRTANSVYTLFLLLIILNSLTESILETQAGVMFYAFFNSILCAEDEK